LVYLEEVEVDIANAVRLVIASHWHDDHINGLHEVLEAAQEASFVCTAVLHTEFVMAMPGLGKQAEGIKPGSGTDEINKILDA